MPLDVDQYNVRRTYRNGVMRITKETTKRSPETGAIIGRESVDVFTFKYSQASLTTDDVKILGTVVERISKKVEIPYNYEFDHSDLSQFMAYIDNTKYNIERTDTTYNRRMFVYLSTVSSAREVNNA